MQICSELQRTVGKIRNFQNKIAEFRSQKNQALLLEMLPILGVTRDKSFTFSGFVRVFASLKQCRVRRLAMMILPALIFPKKTILHAGGCRHYSSNPSSAICLNKGFNLSVSAFPSLKQKSY